MPKILCMFYMYVYLKFRIQECVHKKGDNQAIISGCPTVELA